MNRIEISTHFEKWLSGLHDSKGKAVILGRLKRAAYGNFGDTKNIGKGLWEMRIHFGSGYRLYYTKTGNKIYFILCGGDKSSQIQDISTARKLMEE